MSVTFKSKKAALSVAHEDIFHVGVQPDFFRPVKQKDGSTKFEWFGNDDMLEARNKLPDPDMVNKAYQFYEGEDHNLLTLSNNEAIEGMRAYIKRRKDNLIVELDSEGNELVDCPEGTPFIARVADFMLTPSMYGGYTTATGKTFRFNMGAERNRYITSDTEEITILRAYAKSTHKISDPTYKDPFSE